MCLTEYRVEQTFRDVRITAIYEGASGIHALALATRLLSGRGKAASEAFAAFIKGENGAPELAICFNLWQQAKGHLTDLAGPNPMACNFLNLTAEVLLQLIWSRFRSAADQSPNLQRIPQGVLADKLYHGKVTSGIY